MCFHRYKETELNLENKQEKSRSNSDEFKRLLIGGTNKVQIELFINNRFTELIFLAILNY